jgi:hypothetical protein
MAPVTEMMIPVILIRFSLSLKKKEESAVMKMGLVATIIDARPAAMVFSPVKKKTL